MATVAPAQVLTRRSSSAGQALPSILNYSAKGKQEQYERDKAARMSRAMVAILEQTEGPSETFNPAGAAIPDMETGLTDEPLTITQQGDVPDKVKAASIFHRMVPDATAVEGNQFSTYLDNLFAEREAMNKQIAATKAAQANKIGVDLGTAPLELSTQQQIIAAKATESREDRKEAASIKEGTMLLKMVPDPQMRASLKGATADTVRAALREVLTEKRAAASQAGQDKRLSIRLDAQADNLQKQLEASEKRMQMGIDARAEAAEKKAEGADAGGANQFNQAVTATLSRLQAADPSITRDDAVYVERNRKAMSDGLSKEFGKSLQGGIFEIMENQKYPHGIAMRMAERQLAKGGTVGEAVSESAKKARVAVQMGQIVPSSVWRLNNPGAVKAYLVGQQGLSEEVADEYIKMWQRSKVFEQKANAAISGQE